MPQFITVGQHRTCYSEIRNVRERTVPTTQYILFTNVLQVKETILISKMVVIAMPFRIRC